MRRKHTREISIYKEVKSPVVRSIKNCFRYITLKDVVFVWTSGSGLLQFLFTELSPEKRFDVTILNFILIPFWANFHLVKYSRALCFPVQGVCGEVSVAGARGEVLPCGSTTALLQDGAEPISQVGGASGRARLRKGRTTSWAKEVETERVRDNRGKTKAKGGRGGSAPWQSRRPHCCSVWRTHTGADRYLWKKCCLWRACAGAEEECEEERLAARNCYMWTIIAGPPSPQHCPGCGGGRWTPVEKVKLSLRKGERNGCFNACLFVSHYPILF